MKFSIRDLLWLTMCVAIASGWCVNYQPKPRPDGLNIKTVDRWWENRPAPVGSKIYETNYGWQAEKFDGGGKGLYLGNNKVLICQ